MSDFQHLGNQFADLLGRVNDRFDVEYGPDPRMARVGRLHLPVGKGMLVLNHEFPGEEHLVLTLPDETGGHGVMQFNPNTGLMLANGGPNDVFLHQQRDLEELSDTWHGPGADPQDRQMNQALTERDMRETSSGKYMLGLNTMRSPLYQFDAHSGQVVGSVEED